MVDQQETGDTYINESPEESIGDEANVSAALKLSDTQGETVPHAKHDLSREGVSEQDYNISGPADTAIELDQSENTVQGVAPQESLSGNGSGAPPVYDAGGKFEVLDDMAQKDAVPDSVPLGSLLHYPASFLAGPGVPHIDPKTSFADPSAVLPHVLTFNTTEYIRTAAGNKVCIQSILCGSRNVHMAGRSVIRAGVILRGDLAPLRVGKYVSIGQGTTLSPPFRVAKTGSGYIPMAIGDYTVIGDNCVVSAATIGTGAVIADNCVIGKRCILKDDCSILSGSVLAPDTVVPALTLFGGIPARYLGDLYESASFMHKKAAIDLYNRIHVKF